MRSSPTPAIHICHVRKTTSLFLSNIQCVRVCVCVVCVAWPARTLCVRVLTFAKNMENRFKALVFSNSAGVNAIRTYILVGSAIKEIYTNDFVRSVIRFSIFDGSSNQSYDIMMMIMNTCYGFVEDPTKATALFAKNANHTRARTIHLLQHAEGRNLLHRFSVFVLHLKHP